MSNGPIASEQLRLFIERAERLKGEIKNLQEDLRGVFAEAKGQGFAPAIMKEIIKLRGMDTHARREREALLDTYKAALGMLDGTPLGNWAVQRLAKPAEPDPAEDGDEEQLYQAAVRLVTQERKAAVSLLQRRLTIGYNHAAKLVERMEQEGIVSVPDAKGKREVLAAAAEEEPDAPTTPEPEVTVEAARQQGSEAARAGKPVTSNPFPPRDPRRAAWDEAWCRELGSDGMDIPDALKPSPKPKKGEGEPKGGEE